ncbi:MULTISPECIES: flavin reductase [Nitrospirillum]|uniref:Flavin reductase n=2 Tax=Nitrospirillum TaxID=1543705 RepID=A0A248JV06_9PROT|nr:MULTISPECIES: flavin reductase [Nitrospirillum]ASG22321.1 flavin reductase [Nitrospirillum amazonense CBAmc]MEA1674609.1 flavin reductase [Nitrospirillum sp. BR 11163]TWB43150.1 flavin reductase [Nitrospirillum amazonense]TWB64381.1 flavin reductase [Nitrospirillum amazonense]
MPVEKDQFRAAMARLGAAVSIITSNGPAGRHGMTVSAVCSVTDQPATLLACINRSSRGYQTLKTNGVVCVNVLAARHESLCRLFATPGSPAAERFANELEWDTLQTGAPVLRDAAVALDCTVDAINDVGTHGVLFARVQAIRINDRADGLIYFDRAFHCVRQSVASGADTTD